MTRRQRRATFIGLGVGILCFATFLVLFALRDSVVGFHLPTDIVSNKVPEGRRIRLGGLVAAGSVKREGPTVEFGIADTAATISARYTGVLPDLFREGQGVVAEGRLDAAGRFVADTVLAKHDENYMPPEVANALKAQGMWQHTGPKAEGAKAEAPKAEAPK
jgi:cytochrome c-type biogenesis protein CcmE